MERGKGILAWESSQEHHVICLPHTDSALGQYNEFWEAQWRAWHLVLDFEKMYGKWTGNLMKENNWKPTSTKSNGSER